MSHRTGKSVSWQIQSIRNSFGQRQGLPFADLLTPDMLRQAIGQTDESSEPIYTQLVTLWMFLGQVVDPDHSCRQAVARLLAWLTIHGQPACSAENGAYCKARFRLATEWFSAGQADRDNDTFGCRRISAGGFGGGILAAVAGGVGFAVDQGSDADGRTPLQDAGDGSQGDLDAFSRLQFDSRHDFSSVAGTRQETLSNQF